MTHDDIEILWQALDGRIRSYFGRRVPSEADDLSAQVWLKVVRAAPRYRDRGISPHAWVWTIARNTLIDYFALRRLSELPFSEREPAAEDQAIQVLPLHDAMSRLPDDQRRLLTDWYVNDWNQNDAALHLGVNVNTAKKRRARAIRALRRQLVEVA